MKRQELSQKIIGLVIKRNSIKVTREKYTNGRPITQHQRDNHPKITPRPLSKVSTAWKPYLRDNRSYKEVI